MIVNINNTEGYSLNSVSILFKYFNSTLFDTKIFFEPTQYLSSFLKKRPSQNKLKRPLLFSAYCMMKKTTLRCTDFPYVITIIENNRGIIFLFSFYMRNIFHSRHYQIRKYKLSVNFTIIFNKTIL